jgi:hypothetical protein
MTMPVCRSCLHRGEEHNWHVPACSQCGRRDPDCRNCARNGELRRVRGACLSSDGTRPCSCSKYVAAVDRRVPLNRALGKLRYRRR